MKVKWLGHACFLITSAGGMKIITDPYETSESFKYGEIDESADIVTVSHEHGDHNNVAAVRGNPEVVRGTAKVKGIEFKGILTYHDDVEGHPRGKNTILCFGVDGVRVCHLGDLGHPLSDEQVSELGKVDILLAPVGGNFTIDARVATELCDRLKPAVVIPMHYRNDRCPTFPVTGVDEFLRGKEGVKRLDVSEVDFTPGGFPSATQIIVPLPAL
jgi:L-ascorbate metabolism protein UlaG (beta-lactamase superfamily)